MKNTSENFSIELENENGAWNFIGIEPKLPFLASGKIWHSGWDIPTRWAIDSGKKCFLDDAHGPTLFLVDKTRLLSELHFEKDSNEEIVRNIFNLKPKMPAWAITAKFNRWSPPSDWNDEDFEQ